MERVIYISHGASRKDWFVVEPQDPSVMRDGQVKSLADPRRERRVIRLDTRRPFWPFTRVVARGRR